jgi:hypothetical protein
MPSGNVQVRHASQATYQTQYVDFNDLVARRELRRAGKAATGVQIFPMAPPLDAESDSLA